MIESESNSTASGNFSVANDMIVSLTGFIAILIDVILIYIILHFRRLNTIVYLFLVHRSFAELIRLIVNPITFSMVYQDMHIDLYDLTSEIGSLARTAVALFESFMVFDWMMENFFPDKLELWRNKYKIVVTVVWTPVLLGFLWIFGHMKYNYLVHLYKMFAGSTSLACICFTVILQIIKFFMICFKKKTFSENRGLNIATLSVAMRVVALLLMFIINRFVIFLFFEHLLMISLVLYLSIFCDEFATYFKKFCVCDLKDDSPDDSQIYLCQGCGAYVGFEDLSAETIEENSLTRNGVLHV